MRGRVEWETGQRAEEGRTEGSKLAKGRPANRGSSEPEKPEPEPIEGKGTADGKDESDTADSDNGNDSNEPNHAGSKRMRRQSKTMPRRES